MAMEIVFVHCMRSTLVMTVQIKVRMSLCVKFSFDYIYRHCTRFVKVRIARAYNIMTLYIMKNVIDSERDLNLKLLFPNF